MKYFSDSNLCEQEILGKIAIPFIEIGIQGYLCGFSEEIGSMLKFMHLTGNVNPHFYHVYDGRVWCNCYSLEKVLQISSELRKLSL